MAAPKGNKFALGCTTSGRPPVFKTVAELLRRTLSYFQHCQEQEEKSTITGLALYLGFAERKSLDDYANKSDEYLYVIKRAKLTVENSYECAGQTIDIFALKNMGWIDRHEITGKDGEPVITSITTKVIRNESGD